MRLPKRGQKGFTLIELLIVVAILGVLAAVVIPNVTRFVGSGEQEAAETELHNIQLAVTSMMLENGITEIPNPVLVGAPINDMTLFPDSTSIIIDGKVTDPEGYTYSDTLDKNGYILWGHDITGGDLADANPNQADINYVVADTTQNLYYCDIDGTVHQVLP